MYLVLEQVNTQSFLKTRHLFCFIRTKHQITFENRSGKQLLFVYFKWS